MRSGSYDSPHVAGGLRLDEEGGGATGGFVLRSCGYMRQNRSWSFPQVFSPYWRLYYNFRTGHWVSHEGRAIALTPARFVLVPENVLFHCHSRGVVPHLYIHFNLETGRASARKAPLVVAATKLGRALARALAGAVPGPYPEKAAHLAAALLHTVLGQVRREEAIVRLPSAPLQKVFDHIENHLGGDLSNARLARAAGVSVRGLVRLFREIEASPQDHVREMRLREAARRLAQGGATIDQIAEDLGFANRFYFSRCFSTFFDCAPGRFRERMTRHAPPRN